MGKNGVVGGGVTGRWNGWDIVSARERERDGVRVDDKQIAQPQVEFEAMIHVRYG